MASATWKPAKNGPTTVEELRKHLTALAKKRTGGKLIATKFAKDHLFLGHTKGDEIKIAAQLASLRSVPLSTLMISSMTASAQAEVLNWIAKVPAGKLTFSNGTWTISNVGSTVPAAGSYKFRTVIMDPSQMNRDDIKKKSRKWITNTSIKTPKVACRFDIDGTPMIYHLEY